jgi:hypothetical protein
MGFTQVCSPKFWNKGWDLSTKAWKWCVFEQSTGRFEGQFHLVDI